MIENIKENTYCVEFKSIEEFYNYTCNTPTNDAFKNKELKSKTGRLEFTKTNSYEEAVELMKHGWDDMAKELNQKLTAKSKNVVYGNKQVNKFDVCGYQASVPRYLQGIPTNMISKKNIPVKEKIITINKSVNYNSGVSTKDIISESVRVLQIVKKLEAQGVKVNLNVIFGTERIGRKIICKIRVKNANERLNISKLAFCLVHPSMLRRIIFRFIEVYPHTTNYFVIGYGSPMFEHEMYSVCEKEYIFPAFLRISDRDIEELKDLEKYRA